MTLLKALVAFSILADTSALWPFTSSVDVGPDGSVVAATRTPPQPIKASLEGNVELDDLQDSLGGMDLGDGIEVDSVKTEIQSGSTPDGGRLPPGTPGPDGKMSAFFVNNSPVQVRLINEVKTR
jgi:hypothetical protein